MASRFELFLVTHGETLSGEIRPGVVVGEIAEIRRHGMLKESRLASTAPPTLARARRKAS